VEKFKYCSRKCYSFDSIGKKKPHIGRVWSEESKLKLSLTNTGRKGRSYFGKDSSHWKGGITPLIDQ